MKLKISKMVLPGHLVTKRGDKFIRWNGRNGSLAGVYQNENKLTIITNDAKVEFITVPAGILIQGRAQIAVRDEIE